MHLLVAEALRDRRQVEGIDVAGAVRVLDDSRTEGEEVRGGVGRRGGGGGRFWPLGEGELVLFCLFTEAMEAGFFGNDFGGEGGSGRGVGGGGSLGLGFFDGLADGVLVGGFDAVGVEGVFDFVADLGPNDDPGEGAELGDPAVAEEPGKHVHVYWAVGFRWSKGFIWARDLRKVC